MTEFRRWQRGSQVDPPPVLPLMAVSVLAATRMRSDALARSTNYYIRLAQTLTGDLEGTEVVALRTDLREGGAFLDVAEMWRGIHSWIEAQGGSMVHPQSATIHICRESVIRFRRLWFGRATESH